jgi:copper chaperone CopZ
VGCGSGRESAVILIRIPLLLALLLSFVSSPAPAAVEEVDLLVAGMECPLCARGVEQSVGHLPGVGRVTADLATGSVKVQALEGRSVDRQRVRETISRWGFRVAPEPEVIRAVGTLSHGPRERLTFQVQGTSEHFDLLEGDELRRLLLALPANGNPRIALTARVHSHPQHFPESLSILSFEVKTP